MPLSLSPHSQNLQIADAHYGHSTLVRDKMTKAESLKHAHTDHRMTETWMDRRVV